MQTLMEKEIFEQANVLPILIQKNNPVFREIATAVGLKNLDVIVIAARGTSDHAAVYGKYVLEAATGIPVALAAPSVSTVYKTPYKLRNALVIGISQSGEAADVSSVIVDANKNGVTTIAITNNDNSRLAKQAQYHINCFAGREISVAATKTFSAELLILAKLASLFLRDSALDNGISIIGDEIAKCLNKKMRY